MTITDVKIRRIMNEGKLRAIVSVTFDNVLAVHDIKVIEGQERMFLAMPARQLMSGRFADIVHPTDPELRTEIESAVLSEYKNQISPM